MFFFHICNLSSIIKRENQREYRKMLNTIIRFFEEKSKEGYQIFPIPYSLKVEVLKHKIWSTTRMMLKYHIYHKWGKYGILKETFSMDLNRNYLSQHSSETHRNIRTQFFFSLRFQKFIICDEQKKYFPYNSYSVIVGVAS